MGYLFASGMASLGQMRPETLKGFKEVAKEMAKAEGVPVESTMKMGAQATGTDSNATSSCEPALPELKRPGPEECPKCFTFRARRSLASRLSLASSFFISAP
jgi:hypothetical protein